ncbi:MAG: enoyl-CoA hydratase [Methyloligella sp.]|nr:MAG: enoyl-CoA hydratase [Methyloligella sp.]
MTDTASANVAEETKKETPFLLKEQKGTTLHITLNRPKTLNALSLDMLNAFQEALDPITDDHTIKALIIKGSGKGFCAGHDLKEMQSHRGDDDKGKAYFDELFATCTKMMLTLAKLPIPVIAEIHGVAAAAGCQLVASCDLAIAEDSTIFAVNGIDAGLFCSTPQVALSRNIPRKAALEMLMLGERIDAERALTLGLLNRVVTKETLAETAEDFAVKAAMRSRTVIALGKQAFYKQVELSLEQAYKVMGETIVDNLMMPDAACGMEAFIEKKKPNWPSENQ